MIKVFIDGSAGTTGLRIFDRLSQREDISLIKLPEEMRKDFDARADAINSADVVFLCLPDAAAIEAAVMLKNKKTVIIDTSTAHRTDDGWAFGFPELKSCREKIEKYNLIANPGCHASGFVALIAPLIEAGMISSSLSLNCFSITGYSGGGKKMIAEYETEGRDVLLSAPRQYGLTQQHKHLKEMVKVCGLENAPLFCPVVADFYSGMEVTIPVFAKDIKGNIGDIATIYKNVYTGKIIHFNEKADENGFLSAAAFSGRDDMEITVAGNEDRILLISRFDNLGKGASGAAIQNMNIKLGLAEDTGLSV
ncbi:MAG: N-acetyl-gamma-glutamyl-phosphate reductase [Monoglobales bacterium]